MHPKDKYGIQAFWQPKPERIVINMPVQKFYNLMDMENGVLMIFGDLYEIVGDNQVCGMIDVRVRRMF